MYKFIIFCGRYRFFFSSLSFYHGLAMFLATRDTLVINGRCQGFFTITKNIIWIEINKYIYISLKLSNIIFGFEAPLQCGNTFIVHPLSVEHGIWTLTWCDQFWSHILVLASNNSKWVHWWNKRVSLTTTRKQQTLSNSMLPCKKYHLLHNLVSEIWPKRKEENVTFLWVFPKIGGKNPKLKWMVKIMENPIIGFGGTIIFTTCGYHYGPIMVTFTWFSQMARFNN